MPKDFCTKIMKRTSGRFWGWAVVSSWAVVLSGCGGGSGGGVGVPISSSARTLAGASASGTTDGALAVARFSNPVNVAVDNVGNVYVCDFDNDRVRKISTAGVVSTLVNQANFQRPFGITLAPDGSLYVQTDANDSGSRDGTTGTVWKVNLAGGGATVVARNLGRPRGLAALSNTQIVLVDLVQDDVRILNPTNGTITPLAGLRGSSGSANGTGNAARFDRPYGPAITSDKKILLADQNNNCLRLVTQAGVVTTFAGTGTAGYKDGTTAEAQFSAPEDVDIDTRGFIYVSDVGNHRIRRISPSGKVQTLAGDGVQGYRDGNGLTAEFYGQEGLAVSKDNSKLVVADGNGGDGSNFNRVRVLDIP